MNKLYFRRNFFLIDWRHKRLKNIADLLLFYREHFYGFSKSDGLLLQNKCLCRISAFYQKNAHSQRLSNSGKTFLNQLESMSFSKLNFPNIANLVEWKFLNLGPKMLIWISLGWNFNKTIVIFKTNTFKLLSYSFKVLFRKNP